MVSFNYGDRKQRGEPTANGLTVVWLTVGGQTGASWLNFFSLSLGFLNDKLGIIPRNCED